MSRMHAVVAVVLLAGACKGEPPVVRIALTNLGFDSAKVAMLQEVIDSTHRPGMPRIFVSGISARPEDRLLPLAPEDGPAQESLDLAYRVVADTTVVGVVGPGGSREAIVAGPVFREAGLAFVMPTANSPQISALAPTGVTLAPTIEEEAEFIADFLALQLRAQSALVFYETDEWGSALHRATSAALWFRGIQVLDAVPVGTLTCRTDSERPAAAEHTLRLHKPDVLVLATRNGTSVCLADVAGRMVPGTPLVAGDGTDATPRFMQDLRDLGDSEAVLYSVTFWHHEQVPSTHVLPARLRATFGESPGMLHGMTYEAVMLLVQAIREEGASRQAVRWYLSHLYTDAEAGRRRYYPGEQDSHPRMHMLLGGAPVWSGSADIDRQPAGGARP